MKSVLHNTFLKAVEQLGLKFPGKSISKETGFGNSIVSEYLSGKKEVSENFAAKFCLKFDYDLNAMKRGEVVQIRVPSATTNEEIVLQATVKIIFEELANLKAIVTGQDLPGVITDMKDRTSLIIADMLKRR